MPWSDFIKEHCSGLIDVETDSRQLVIYARVSTRNQKDDLQNQVSFLRQFCNAST